MLDAKQYRRYAEECRSLARVTESGNRRNILLKMAETWEILANNAESQQVAAKSQSE